MFHVLTKYQWQQVFFLRDGNAFTLYKPIRKSYTEME